MELVVLHRGGWSVDGEWDERRLPSQNQITQDPQSRLRALDFILKPWGALFRASKSGAARFLFEKYSSLDMEWEAGGMEAGRQSVLAVGWEGVGDECCGGRVGQDWGTSKGDEVY